MIAIITFAQDFYKLKDQMCVWVKKVGIGYGLSTK